MKSPFVGLRPFRTAESNLFFGRSRDIAKLENLALVVPVLVIYAPSGTGKSSLLNAGLLPALQSDATLVPITISDPRENVEEIVREQLVASGALEDVDHRDMGLAEALQRHFEATERRVILILDQFEERLKQIRALENLYAEIARLANTRSDAATVVISIREDYLGGLESLMRRIAGLLDASYRVPKLSRRALTEAVYGPLGVVGSKVTLEEGLVEEVLRDLERESHPGESLDGSIEAGYFQVVWAHLWEKDAARGDGRLTKATYHQEGGATRILESFVSATLSQLLPFEAEVLRAVTRYLVLPSGAKVPLTVDDLVGLLRSEDFTAEGREILFPQSFMSAREVRESEIRQILVSVFSQLTRTDAPLFRRAMRGAREEFELVHDLLGLIFLKWREQYNEMGRYEVEVTQDIFRRRMYPDEPRKVDTSEFELEEDERSRLAYDTPATEDPEIPSLVPIARVLRQVGRRYRSVKTVTEVEENWQSLRAVLRDVARLLQRLEYREKSIVQNQLGSSLDVLYSGVLTTALSHSSRDVRRLAQVQVYQLLSIRKLLGPQYNYGSNIRYSLPRNIAVWFVSLVFAIVGTVSARWLIDQVWDVPDVEYLPLTMGLIALGAASVYSFVYVDQANSEWLTWRGVRRTLFPALSRKRSSQSRDAQVSGRLTMLSVVRALGVLTSWPVHFLIILVLCFAGAVVFELFGWAPTAGFNLVALFASVGVAVWYASEV